MSSPGRARALRALGAARRANVRRVAAGRSPVVNGKKVSAKSIGLTKAKAKERISKNSKHWAKMPKTKAARSRYKK